MTITKTSILLNSANIQNGVVLNLTEWVDYSWADELTFIIDVQQTLNNPTAGTLLAKFQKRVPHKNGAIQYNNQRLVDLSPEEQAGMLPLGGWPAKLADYTLATQLSYQRTATNFGPGLNLCIYTAGLVGTGAGFQTTALVVAKGR